MKVLCIINGSLPLEIYIDNREMAKDYIYYWARQQGITVKSYVIYLACEIERSA